PGLAVELAEAVLLVLVPRQLLGARRPFQVQVVPTAVPGPRRSGAFLATVGEAGAEQVDEDARRAEDGGGVDVDRAGAELVVVGAAFQVEVQRAHVALGVDVQHGAAPARAPRRQAALAPLDLLQQGTDLEEVGLALEQGQLGEALGQVQAVGAEVVEDVAEHPPVAVDEEVPVPVLQQRDLAGEHGAEHGVAAPRERVQRGHVHLAPHVHRHRVLQGLRACRAHT
uniref:Uncharacterized protein n=1 Tax=Denticeps clupeoides TaxID=299321 RepID=A0AAY4BZM6_9TELE